MEKYDYLIGMHLWEADGIKHDCVYQLAGTITKIQEDPIEPHGFRIFVKNVNGDQEYLSCSSNDLEYLAEGGIADIGIPYFIEEQAKWALESAKNRYTFRTLLRSTLYCIDKKVTGPELTKLGIITSVDPTYDKPEFVLSYQSQKDGILATMHSFNRFALNDLQNGEIITPEDDSTYYFIGEKLKEKL